MPRIQQLDTAIVNKIAAGEVIERPASVVKELLENSVDALANRIEVDIEAGGSERIRVVDDGEGIHSDDLPLAVTSHATSKIRSAEDLFGVHTLGFRGEALASIAEVSRFHIRSRTAESDSGCEVRIDCGRSDQPRPCGCPVGTLIDVVGLFTNTPVRRKFLKRPSTEFGHIAEQFTRVALAHPRLHMRLRHNEKNVFDLAPTDRLFERLELFYGKDLAEQLIWVESESDGCRIWGYVGHPSQSKSTRKSQYLFLNGRPIKDRSLSHALSEAYRGLVMVGRQPVAFLFLELPVDQVDVNVHPTKIEVRFQDSQQLYRQLLSMIRTTFLGLPLETSLRIDAAPGALPAGGPHQKQLAMPSLAPRPTSTTTTTATVAATTAFSPTPIRDSVSSPTSPADREPNVAEPVAEPVAEMDHVRALQVHDCYLVLETPEGLTIVDQHALHERILYEQLKQRMLEGTLERQQLLVPETVELSPKDAALIGGQAELLGELGFEIAAFGNNTVLVHSYPALLKRINLTKLLADLAEGLGRPEQAPQRRDILESLLQMMACKAAIKAGHRLTREEMDSLLSQRHLVDDAHHCPHGRPTALVLSQAELDRQFGRLG